MSYLQVTVSLYLLLFSCLLVNGEQPDRDAAARAWFEQFSCPVLPWAPRQDDRYLINSAAMPEEWSITLKLSPAEKKQVVRGTLPFPAGMFTGKDISVSAEDQPVKTDIRILTRHPDASGSIRRAMVTFLYDPQAFHGVPEKIYFRRAPSPSVQILNERPARQQGGYTGQLGPFRIELDRSGVRLFRQEVLIWEAIPVSPESSDEIPVWTEIIEEGRWYLWVRQFQWHGRWPRMLDIRLDVLGNAVLVARLQKRGGEDGYCPELGWNLRLTRVSEPLPDETHSFTQEEPWSYRAGDQNISLPQAHRYRKGQVSVTFDKAAAEVKICYRRSTGDDRVPHQPFAWRTATIAVGPNADTLNDLLEGIARMVPDAVQWQALYPEVRVKTWSPELEAIRAFHREWIAEATLEGDDFGNVTSMPLPEVFGMNRLNHNMPIFEEYYRSGDPRLRRVALLWCDNMHDLSIWWGDQPEGQFGGTRYNNISVQNGQHGDDPTFMWRSNNAVTFCTKGYDTFFCAWEETGDPRMAVTLLGQAAYAFRAIHANTGECRNIGDVLDFVRLYEYTGHRPWLEKAHEMFHELREKLGSDNLFSQGGEPILPDETFIDTDEVGSRYPFAKPYILGYALTGLPRLLYYYPEEPRLADTVRAIAQFLAKTVDLAGGWRYPHPRSSRVLVAQGMEHAAQLVRAAQVLGERGENIEPLLKAIETVLRARVLAVNQKHTVVNVLEGWESAAGIIPAHGDLHALYRGPEDRDASRDYTEGLLHDGASPPEGIVYFTEVLDGYAGWRKPDSLFHGDVPLPLKQMLERLPDRALTSTAGN